MNDFLKKVFKRLRKIGIRIFPYNRFYRPKGYYKTVNEFIESSKNEKATFIELYPEYVSDIQISQDFMDQCTVTRQITPVKVAKIPPSRLVQIPNGRLYSDGVEHVTIITEDNMVLGEVTYQNYPSNNIEDNILLKQNYFIPVKKLKGVAFHTLIGGSGHTNYFHWLFDSLPRFHLLQKSGWFDKVDWFVVPGYKIDYQRDSLRMLGIPDDKLVEASAETHIQADLLLTTTYVRHSEHIAPWSCDFLREHFLKPEAFTGLKTHPYVYISRKDAKRRIILNEPEFENMLQEYGFKSFELTGLSLMQKIQLFHDAEIIIATHGAGQANVVFCKKGAEVIELIPDCFAFTYYYDIANKVGVNFDYVMFKSHPRSNSTKQKMYANMTADLEKVRQKLNKIIGPIQRSELQQASKTK